MAHHVDPNISDLFFNTDLSEASQYDGKHQFTGYNEVRLSEAAGLLLDSLQHLGVHDLPSIEDLIKDFYGRI